MGKRVFTVLLCAAMALSLCGCGLYEKEYVAESDYIPSAPDNSGAEERIMVRNFNQLRQALISLVSSGKHESSIIFDSAYEGEITEDMASACWQVRTQDALCAYCVENISYELIKIVSYYVANLSVRYSSAVSAPGEVVRMTYTTGVDELVRKMMEAGKTRLAVLVTRSFYSAEGMEELVSGVYRADPILAPQEPTVSVLMLNGSGTQRLYEIDLDYGMDDETRRQRLEKLQAQDPFAGQEFEGMDQAHLALAACQWLTEHCSYLPDGPNDIYSALIDGAADEEGFSFAYVRLCRLLGLECLMVYGQRSWEDYCWNIVQIDGEYYHVDPAICAAGDYENGFLLRDEDMWEDCRWDVSAYPRCSGEQSWESVTRPETPEPEEEEETTEAQEEGAADEENENNALTSQEIVV